jgi:8-oxo-dGTP diphosphatase
MQVVNCELHSPATSAMLRRAMASLEKRPIVTVDTVLFTLHDGGLATILQPRARPPHAGRLALVGGYVRPEEDAGTLEAAARILADKAGLAGLFLEQLMTFAGPERDPRGWSLSVAHYALVPQSALARAARDLAVLPLNAVPPMPFDHDAILAAALARLRGKSAWSTLPAFLLPETFTLPMLKAVYETVMGERLNDSAFRRKIAELRIIEEVPDARSPATAERRRPAQLYRLARRALVAFDRVI